MGKRNSFVGREGFTLIESITALAVLAIIMLVMLTISKPKMQILKAKDGQRKSDLSLISKALEDYLNDNPCYPDVGVFSVCGGDSFHPYLVKFPCDPVTKQPYSYVRPECQKYVIRVTLSTQEDYVVTSPNYSLP